jgi:conjugative transposon TraM protein
MKSAKEVFMSISGKNKIVLVGAFTLVVIVISAIVLYRTMFANTGPGANDYDQLSLELPRAMPSQDSAWKKLKFYEKADKDLEGAPRSFDSLNLEIADQSTTTSFFDSSLQETSDQWNKHLTSRLGDQGPELFTPKDPTELKVYNKLQELNTALATSKKNERVSKLAQKQTASERFQSSSLLSSIEPDPDAEAIIASGDPEMRQIDGMLEKILDIQHPDRLKQKLKEKSRENETHVYPVSISDSSVNVTMLAVPGKKYAAQAGSSTTHVSDPAFLSISKVANEAEQLRPITAMIEERQTIVSGATVKIKILTEVLVNGVTLSKNELIYGKASLAGDRLQIKITSIQHKGNILPVQLAVYDLDGQEGIYVPGSITRDAVKQSTDQAIQGFNMASLDPSIGAQAASAGIQAAKSLVGKKAKLVKVSLKAGYLVLLKNSGENN